jgi:Ribonuclease G/E
VKLLASISPGEMRVAAWDGVLHDYAIWRPGAPDGVGELHRGRVIARVPAMAGAFVVLANAEGFLPDSEGAADAGTILGVRITRAAQGGKGPRLSARLTEAQSAQVGSGPPSLLAPGPNAIERLRARHPDAPIDIDDPGTAARLGFPTRLVARAFDDAVEAAIELLSEPVCPLPGGARLSVYPTPALTALDVDLAGLSGDRRGKHASQAAANRALLPALARQIRLRDLSGAILVDLAGLTTRKRAALAGDFIAALAADPLAPRFLGFTALGLAEILRPRIHPPLHELQSGPHAAGLMALRHLARQIAAVPHRNPALRASPEIATALRADSEALAALRAIAGRSLDLTEDRTLPAPFWRIED